MPDRTLGDPTVLSGRLACLRELRVVGGGLGSALRYGTAEPLQLFMVIGCRCLVRRRGQRAYPAKDGDHLTADTYVSATSYYAFGAVYQQLLGAGMSRVRGTTVDGASGRLTAKHHRNRNGRQHPHRARRIR
jgi:hypothetical protein